MDCSLFLRRCKLVQCTVLHVGWIDNLIQLHYYSLGVNYIFIKQIGPNDLTRLCSSRKEKKTALLINKGACKDVNCTISPRLLNIYSLTIVQSYIRATKFGQKLRHLTFVTQRMESVCIEKL